MGMILTRRYNVDRFGYLIPHRYGNLPMMGAVATYRPGEGRFGGAVAVEEGTTNLWSGTSNKTRTWRRNGGSWITFVSDNEILVDFTVEGSADALLYNPSLNGVSEGPYTFSVEYEVYEFHTTASKANGFSIYIYDASENLLGQSEILQPKPGERGRLHVTVNNPAENTSFSRVAVTWGLNMAVGDRVRMRVFNFQIEAKPFATSFVDGWRAAGRLSYPKSLIAGLNALTVAAWTSGPTSWGSGGHKYLVAAQTSGGNPYGDIFALRQLAERNGISLWVRNDANSASAEPAYNNVWDGNWHLIVGVINKSPEPGRQPIELYVDGELVASDSNVNAVPDLSTIDETWGVQVGHWRGSMQWNGLIDELLILPYAASEEEIASWYEAQGPLPPHPQASLQWDRQTVRPAQMTIL